MKKIISAFLTIAMLLSSLPVAFAAESDQMGDYNSLKIPVVNEVRDENSDVDYVQQSFSLMSLDNSAASGGSSGGGGGVAVGPSSGSSAGYDEATGYITINTDLNETENKGDILVVSDFRQYVSEDVLDAYDGFFDDYNMSYYQDRVIAVYEKDGKQWLAHQSQSDTANYELTWGLLQNEDTFDLHIPVPQELENGTYDVKLYQIPYSKSDYTGMSIALKVSVTDADETNENPYSLRTVVRLKNNVVSVLEGEYEDIYFPVDGEIELPEDFSGGADISGFAFSSTGACYSLDAYLNSMTGNIEPYDSFMDYPAGTYTCWFYTYSNMFEEGSELSNMMFGPATINVSGIKFQDQYFGQNEENQYVYVDLSESVVEGLPSELSASDVTASIDFKDSEGNLVHSFSAVELEDLYVYAWSGSLTFNMNFIGFEVGTYIADITLNNVNGETYELGAASFEITDKEIIEYISIVNYDGELTTSTEYFYVDVRMKNMFLDYDKLNINLVNSNGDVVAKTVSKELRDVSKYNGSELLYKLEVVEPLVAADDYYRSEYSLDIQSDPSIELISEANNVYIRVTDSASVVRAELIGTNTVKFFTENLLAGEYVVKSRHNDDEIVYNVTVDDQGVGTFQIENIGDTYYYFDLYNIDDSYIDDFNVRVRNENDHFSATPSFLSPSMTNIDNFYVRVETDYEKPSVDQIEYAKISQNGEEIAVMSNMEIDGWSYYSGGPIMINLYGKLTLNSGKSFSKGDAVFEIKYKDGYTAQHTIPVAGPEDGLWGDLELVNSCYYNADVDGDWCNYAVGSNKAKFIISDTNITSGVVKLYNESTQSDEAVETLNIADLTKTTEYGYSHTYTGEFSTVLSSDSIYTIDLEANDDTMNVNRFTYYSGKMMEQNNDLTAANGECEIYCYDWINVSNIQAITFKAVVGSNEYNVPVTTDYSGDDYINFIADFSNVPVGYFKLKAFDGAAEIKMTNRTLGYNFGNVERPVTTGAGWKWDGDVRIFTLWGANLDKVDSAYIKLYKVVDFTEDSDNYNQSKLSFVKDIELSGPYNKNSISVNNALLEGLETGNYTIVYMLDGKAAETQEIYIKGSEPEYKANVVLNDGISSTNKTSVDMTISYTGYTKMRIAFAEGDLENASYENIVTQKTISLEGKNGLVTIYVQFANDDESKKETIAQSITVDSEAPQLTDVVMPESIGLWNYDDITFVSNENLRNAFLVIGEVNAETGDVEGKTYTFTFQGVNEGKYAYKCNVYAGSQFENVFNVKTQIIAVDKAGNRTAGEVKDLSIVQPRDISGKLLYNGNAVTNTSVYLYKGEDYYTSTYTNNLGEFTFYNISEDDYTIVVDKYGYNKESVNVAKAEFATDITEKNIELTSIYSEEGIITVTLKDASNAAIANAYVEVYSWDTGINLTATTSEDGTATVTVPYQTGGTGYRVYINSNDYSDNKWIDVDGDENVEFVLPQKATINGVVKHGETVIPNAQITVSGNGYSSYVFSNENGEFSAEVYLRDSNRTFKLSTGAEFSYSGSAEVTFEESETVKDVTLQLGKNAFVYGSVKDANGNVVTDFKEVRFYNRGGYEYVVPVDENGEFKTEAFLSGTYTFYLSDYDYDYSYDWSSLSQTVTITEEDMAAGSKEITFTPARYTYTASKFTTGNNGISASADVIAKGGMATVIVKFQNDGTKKLENVTAYAKLPEGITVKKTNGVVEDGKVSKTVASLKADESGSMTFTIDTTNYEEPVITIPAYVVADSKEYSLGSVTINVVSVSLSAPEIVKKNVAFKVSGEALKDSVVEILNYDTKEVLATTEMMGKWYSADVTLADSANLVAKVTKDGITGYSKPVYVKAEDDPLAVADIKMTDKAKGITYTKNELYDYPTFSVIVYSELIGPNIEAAVKFDNMPEGATVTYSLANKKNVAAVKDSNEYYKATIKNWRGSGSNKVYATVTDGDKEYKFVVAEIIILIDPSGYITDAETGKPVVGASVLIEEKYEGAWRTWNATPHGQENPMLTNSEGHYGWDVPEGEYRIIVSKDGYETKIVETYDSRDYGANSAITVLPIRTDVDIQIENARPIEIDTSAIKAVAGSKVKFVFSRPVDVTTVTNENIVVLDSSNNPVAGTLGISEDNTTVIFKPTSAMANGDYTISVKDIKDTKGNTITSEDIPFAKASEVAALANPTVANNSTDGTVTITFTDEVVNVNEIKVMQGTSEVSGTLRKEGNVVTFIPDSAFTSGTTYKVIVSDMIRTGADNYMSAAYETTFTTSGGGGGGSSSGGGGGGGATTTSFKITVVQGENGKISPETVSVKKGESKTFTITADEGYVIEDVIVNNKSVGAVSTYTFEKIEAAATITAKFKKAETTSEGTWTNPFADVKASDWFYKAVEFASKEGITSGVSATSFAPNDKVTRGQFITMLCRAYGVEEMTGDNFADCGDTWYTGYLAAAKQLGISNGVGDNKFAPEKEITREEMVTLIYNYLKSIGEVTEGQDTTSFADDADISEWAKAGVAYANENGIVNGKGDNKFAPKDTATRAELVQIFYNIFSTEK